MAVIAIADGHMGICVMHNLLGPGMTDDAVAATIRAADGCAIRQPVYAVHSLAVGEIYQDAALVRIKGVTGATGVMHQGICYIHRDAGGGSCSTYVTIDAIRRWSAVFYHQGVIDRTVTGSTIVIGCGCRVMMDAAGRMGCRIMAGSAGRYLGLALGVAVCAGSECE